MTGEPVVMMPEMGDHNSKFVETKVSESRSRVRAGQKSLEMEAGAEVELYYHLS